ncbi:MAG: J domain-containing protein [Pseudomonadota bacterium]
MGLLAILLIGVAGWLIWTGRLQRITAKDGLMLGIAIVGAVMAAKGKPLIGVLPVIVSVIYAAMRVRKPAKAVRAAPDESRVADARELLGLSANADAEDIRAAHRRLIATVHPDKGGTQALAAKINEARDVLLQHYAILHMHNEQDSGRDR